jgi:hypothetical protein
MSSAYCWIVYLSIDIVSMETWTFWQISTENQRMSLNDKPISDQWICECLFFFIDQSLVFYVIIVGIS